MMRILLAVNDSPAGLAAARAAIHLGEQAGGQVRSVHVLGEPGARAGLRRGSPRVEVDDRGTADSAAALDYVVGLAGTPVCRSRR